MNSDNHKLSVIIVSGLSGSGKSTALHVLEDMGYFMVEGLPSALLVQMISMFSESKDLGYKGVVLGVDFSQNTFIGDYNKAIQDLMENGVSVSILFLEASSSVLVKRYATTRRPHPLQIEGLGLEQAIELERKRLDSIRQKADLVIDTSSYSIHDLRRLIQTTLNTVTSAYRPLRLHVISFGFKYGSPAEADFMFDLRCLPNPYFVPELQKLSGKENSVAAYVLESDLGKGMYEHIINFLDFALDKNESEGRFRLTIAIGCTGGRHRSVAMTEAITKYLRDKGFFCSCEHRHLALGEHS